MKSFLTQRTVKVLYRHRLKQMTVALHLLGLMALIALSPVTIAQESTEKETTTQNETAEVEVFEFDHFNTGFALEGVHASLECESCHTRGQFEGTVTDCASCHSEGSAVNASAKPQNHIQVIDQCEDCHTPQEWTFVSRVDHISTLGSCQSCHDNFIASGKPADHVTTSQNCDSCHNTAEWVSVNFDHSEALGSCQSCHLSDKDPHPINPVSNECEACHATTMWVPTIRVDHDEIPTTVCSACHGSTAAGKPSDHIEASNNCESCHRSTMDWFVNPQIGVDHSEIPRAEMGMCVFCHNGVIARGQHAEHIPTGGAECITCHQPNQGWQFDTSGL